MGICNIYSNEYAHRPQEKKPLLLVPLRKYTKERKPMIAQSLHQPVFTYTGCTNKILQWNSQKLGHLRTQPWNFTQCEFLLLECNISGVFFFLFPFSTAAWGVLHLSCLLALIVVLLVYFSGCSSCAQFVYCHFVCSFPIQGFISIFTYLCQ